MYPEVLTSHIPVPHQPSTINLLPTQTPFTHQALPHKTLPIDAKERKKQELHLASQTEGLAKESGRASGGLPEIDLPFMNEPFGWLPHY